MENDDIAAASEGPSVEIPRRGRGRPRKTDPAAISKRGLAKRRHPTQVSGKSRQGRPRKAANVAHGAGRPQHEPTAESRKRVQLCAAFGNTPAQIAMLLDISAPTVRLHYHEELKSGRVNANNAVMVNLYQQATKDDLRAVRAIELWMRRTEPDVMNRDRLPEERQPRPAALGKKAIAERDGQEVPPDSSWADLLPSDAAH